MQNLTDTNNLSNPALFNVRLLIVQVLVGILLYVNGLMIFTFLKKEIFWVETRYILFAQTLFVDSTNMLLTDLTMVGTFYRYPIHIIPCCLFCVLMSLLSICTPVTLVAMCLERYVAICMPLRHSSISTTKNTFIGLLIIWTVSFIIPLFVFIVFLITASPVYLNSYVVCSFEVMLQIKWLADTRAASLQALFIILFVHVVFIYIKIMKAARSATTDNKNSSNKSHKTVILHGIQLFLCMLQLLMPHIEMPLWKMDIVLLQNVKYSNFILFMISPRCLSPLIYGLRDKMFCHALRHYALCGVTFEKKTCKISHVKTIALDL